MKTKKKDSKLIDFSEIEKLNPIERQKILKRLLSKENNRELFKRINEEIIRAELEEEDLEKSLEEPKKEEKEKTTGNLDKLVERFAEKTETKEEEKGFVSGVLYNVKEEEHHHAYQIYTSYNPVSHEEPMKREFTSTEKSFLKEEVESKIEEQNLSIETGIKKITDLYKGKKKEEHNGH